MGVEDVDDVSNGGFVVTGSPFSLFVVVVGAEDGVFEDVDGGSVVTGSPFFPCIDVGGTEEEEPRSF